MFRFRSVIQRRLGRGAIDARYQPTFATSPSGAIDAVAAPPCRTASMIVNSDNNRLQPVMNVNRSFTSSGLTDEKEIQKRLDDFQELFVEARLCIEDVNDSVGTTYYEEDVDEAIKAVDEAVTAFKTLLDDIQDEKQKNRIMTGNGLKVEQLKGELKMALDSGDDHH